MAKLTLESLVGVTADLSVKATIVDLKAVNVAATVKTDVDGIIESRKSVIPRVCMRIMPEGSNTIATVWCDPLVVRNIGVGETCTFMFEGYEKEDGEVVPSLIGIV